ncbi:MAG: DotU family type IV/VI secretion system protein [Proteobacteria bacterium]|nr:DotU family type IV/VI secretion system protein [Pseudomonadota bacterium]
MATHTITDSNILRNFRDFQVLLTTLKESAKTGNWIFSGEVEEKTEEPEGDAHQMVTSNAIFQKFVSLFEKQELEAGRLGGEFGANLYNKIRFIMANFCDEVFLNLDWIERDNWSKNLMETRFYKTNSGGELFFRKLDNLLQERDPINSEVALVYLMALAMGFRGKYHGINDDGRIEKYKQQLYSFAFQEKADLETESRVLVPGAYSKPLKKKPKLEIPGLKKWIGFVILLCGLLVGSSHLIWTQMTDDIEIAVKKVLTEQKAVARTEKK